MTVCLSAQMAGVKAKRVWLSVSGAVAVSPVMVMVTATFAVGRVFNLTVNCFVAPSSIARAVGSTITPRLSSSVTLTATEDVMPS